MPGPRHRHRHGQHVISSDSNSVHIAQCYGNTTTDTNAVHMLIRLVTPSVRGPYPLPLGPRLSALGHGLQAWVALQTTEAFCGRVRALRLGAGCHVALPRRCPGGCPHSTRATATNSPPRRSRSAWRVANCRTAALRRLVRWLVRCRRPMPGADPHPAAHHSSAMDASARPVTSYVP